MPLQTPSIVTVSVLVTARPRSVADDDGVARPAPRCAIAKHRQGMGQAPLLRKGCRDEEDDHHGARNRARRPGRRHREGGWFFRRWGGSVEIWGSFYCRRSWPPLLKRPATQRRKNNPVVARIQRTSPFPLALLTSPRSGFCARPQTPSRRLWFGDPTNVNALRHD